MRKIGVFGKDSRHVRLYEQKLRKAGFETGLKGSDMTISLGGDGTYLLAERKFPGIPKLLVRDSHVCYNCDERFNVDDVDSIIEKIAKKEYRIRPKSKLEAVFNHKPMTCVNDLSIRNKNAWEAIRFGVKVDGKAIHKELIGDGVVVSTPFGSTGYYHSITRKSFSKGIGIAFNNSTIPVKPLLLPENSVITITITRGVAELTTDNDPKTKIFRNGASVVIRKKKKSNASLVSLK